MYNTNSFIKRNLLFMFISFVITIFTCSFINANYDGKDSSGLDVSSECLKFTAGEDNSKISFKWKEGSNVKYQKNDGDWTDYSKGSELILNNQDIVRFKGTGIKTDVSDHFVIEGKVAASGCVDSLRLDNGGKFQGLEDGCYYQMFMGCSGLTSAPELKANTLKPYCYNEMFRNCTGLETAPSLSAEEMEAHCYDSMFAECTGLKGTPNLPSTTLADHCYNYMFAECSNLTSVTDLPASKLAPDCYKYMFKGCSSLINAPNLLATTLAVRCYQGMFENCTSLKKLPIIPTETITVDTWDPKLNNNQGGQNIDNKACYDQMFNGCSSLKLSREQSGPYQEAWSFNTGGYGVNSDFGSMFDSKSFRHADRGDDNDSFSLPANNNTTMTLYIAGDNDGPVLGNGTIYVTDKIPSTELRWKEPNNGNISSIDNLYDGNKAYITLKEKYGDQSNVGYSKDFNLTTTNDNGNWKTIIPEQDLYKSLENRNENNKWENKTPKSYSVFITVLPAA